MYIRTRRGAELYYKPSRVYCVRVAACAVVCMRACVCVSERHYV